VVTMVMASDGNSGSDERDQMWQEAWEHRLTTISTNEPSVMWKQKYIEWGKNKRE